MRSGLAARKLRAVEACGTTREKRPYAVPASRSDEMFCQALTPEQIKRIDTASRDILQATGVHVPHEKMLERFADAGAAVDGETQVVRIPPELIDRCLASAGKQFTLYGRDVTRTAEFGAGKRNYNSIAGEAMWVDSPGGPRRYATLADVATATRFGDALDEINMPGAMTDPQDIPVAYRCVATMAEMLRNTTKPITFWLHDRGSARFLVDMLIALRGSEQAAQAKPVFYPFLEPISPLRFPLNGVDLLFETARLNLPVPIGPMAQTGLSAPATLAGTMAVENAEILAGVCITQLIRERMPVCYGGICHAFDMRTTQLIFAGPEQAIFGVAMTQMGKHYGLPVYVNVGLTDAKRPDAQAGLEAAATLLPAAAAGADIFGHMGIAGVDQATSLEMLVLQSETIAYVESAMREIDFSDDAFALGEIHDAGPGGAFINRMHTAEHFRKELWFPTVLDREFYQAWADAGATTTEQRCCQRRDELLASHEVEPVSAELDRALTDIVEGARKELAS
ncbi:MAG: trimethylamine methyltransferase family protein [Planctomycetota bacterium]|jgi:trimethylamine--corrinoid protein Co-methyltransferase